METQLTNIIGCSQEVDHHCGIAYVGQDGVMEDHQHLLVHAAGQLQGMKDMRLKIWDSRLEQKTSSKVVYMLKWILYLILQKPEPQPLKGTLVFLMGRRDNHYIHSYSNTSNHETQKACFLQMIGGFAYF